jgi:hypothetical protein
MVRNLYIIFAFSLLFGCATTASEHMMADGNTWSLKINDLSECNGFSSNNTCVSGIMPLIERRATELCGKAPQRIFACGKSTDGGIVGVRCSVQCDDAATVRVKESKGSISPDNKPALEKLDQEVIKKAKRCQDKGGMWINDSCQIDIDTE